jgi:hypothetical protein
VVHKATVWKGNSACLSSLLGVNTNLIIQGDNWNDLLKEVITFNSVEEFWGVYVSYYAQHCSSTGWV